MHRIKSQACQSFGSSVWQQCQHLGVARVSRALLSGIELACKQRVSSSSRSPAISRDAARGGWAYLVKGRHEALRGAVPAPSKKFLRA